MTRPLTEIGIGPVGRASRQLRSRKMALTYTPDGEEAQNVREGPPEGERPRASPEGPAPVQQARGIGCCYDQDGPARATDRGFPEPGREPQDERPPIGSCAKNPEQDSGPAIERRSFPP